MSLIRTSAPNLNLPETVNIIKPKEVKLDNGLSVYVISSGNEDVVKFEIVFKEKYNDNNTYFQSLACHYLADSGTAKKMAIDIAEELDFYGAFLQSDSGPDYKSFSLFSLCSLFENAIKIVPEILFEATFPEQEVTNWKKRNIQTLLVNKEKVSWQARTAFNEKIYGKLHPYGFTADTEFYESIESSSLLKFYSTAYNFNNAFIIVSGKIDDKILSILNKEFGSIEIKSGERIEFHQTEFDEYFPEKIKIKKSDSVQNAVRIGKRLFGKNHPDFLPMLITNTILGGYFGSRLMSNIREDKGYTYGIGSGLHPHIESGSFFISTEVGKDVCNPAITEIYKEIARLINEPISEKELLLVKNYLFGTFQRSIDGPFELAERFKGLKLHDLQYEYYDKYLYLLKNFTPQMVMETAAKYLQPGSMSEIIAGN